MASDWRNLCWGDLVSLEYGRALRGHGTGRGSFRVFGTNGPIGWHDEALCFHPGVIIGRKGAYRGVHYSPAPFFVIDTAFYLEPKTEIDLLWAYYELLSHDINSMDSGSAIPSTSREAFYALQVRVPPLSEQRAIAHILGTLDDKIELNRRMNETLEAMARAIFKSWFIDFDPVIDNALRAGNPIPSTLSEKAARRREMLARAKAEGRDSCFPKHIAALFPDHFVDSELGLIPEEWETVTFAETVDIIGGGTPKTSVIEYWDGDIPWFSVVDAPLESDIWVIDTEKKISQLGLENSSTRVLKEGTTIISARGTVGKVALVGMPTAMNQSCYGLRDKKSELGFFTYYATQALVSNLLQRTHGSVFATITRDTLKSVIVVSPPENFIRVFENNITPLLYFIRKSIFESRTLAALRDALLPKLISGEFRVDDAERFI
jgi:type I restriction enzyme S subunit